MITPTPSAGSKPIGSPRKSHAIADDIEASVRARRLKAGERLPSEEELCQKFGASRAVIREAIHRLKTRGLVQSVKGSGSYIADFNGSHLRSSLELYSSLASDGQSFLELYDLRMLIETECARRVAEVASPGAIAAIKQSLDVMAANTTQLKRFADADIAFHLAIVTAAGHTLFAEILGALLKEIGIRMTRQTYNSVLVVRNLRAHTAIYRAIAAGDSVAAQEAMRQHLMASRTNIISYLRGDAESQPGK